MSLALSEPRRSGLVVVKLGGSVIRSPRLRAWLDAIARTGRQTVVVPGGGALADEVRAAQSGLGFDDAAAHRMALLAMDQLAWAVAGLDPRFTVGTDQASLRAILSEGRVALWAPYAMVANDRRVASDWTVTSDSLALWLTAGLEADACYVIKSAERRQRRSSAAELARQGIVDAAFPGFLASTDAPVYLLGPGDVPGFAEALQTGVACGAVIARGG